MDAHALGTAIRWLHVAAMAAALGGSVLLAMTARSAPAAVALAYERVFWVAAGVLAMTGVGNAAEFGVGLPGPASDWGQTFTFKLVTVLALMLVSVPRTIIAARRADGTTETALASARSAQLHATTAALLLVALAFAVWMAHG